MMLQSTLNRTEILSVLRAALEPLEYVHAMWEGGAASFGRVDEWSDIDLQIDVEDDRVADAVAVFERALAGLSPIDLKYELPMPTWHGHYQSFYRLERASRFLLIDFVAIRHSDPNKFLQPEIHGDPVVHFDKAEVVRWTPLDRAAWTEKLRARVETLRINFDLFRVFTLKELNRGNNIEALSFYQGMVLRPLVEALRIKYSPARFNFHTRYVQYDLPADIAQSLEPLFFIADPSDLREKLSVAEEMFLRTIEEIDLENIRLDQESPAEPVPGT